MPVRAGQILRTHCRRGHARTPDNLWGHTCKLCKQEFNRQAHIREVTRGFARAKRYGLSVEQAEAMSVAQNNRCAICGEEFSGTPYIDHDHITQNVRGLLCHHCNSGIGMFRDDPALLRAAIEYLRQHKVNTD